VSLVRVYASTIRNSWKWCSNTGLQAKRYRVFLDSRGRVTAATIDDERRRGKRADTQSSLRVNQHGSWSFKEVF
jgi:hypothetical protein